MNPFLISIRGAAGEKHAESEPRVAGRSSDSGTDVPPWLQTQWPLVLGQVADGAQADVGASAQIAGGAQSIQAVDIQDMLQQTADAPMEGPTGSKVTLATLADPAASAFKEQALQPLSADAAGKNISGAAMSAMAPAGTRQAAHAEDKRDVSLPIGNATGNAQERSKGHAPGASVQRGGTSGQASAAAQTVSTDRRGAIGQGNASNQGNPAGQQAGKVGQGSSQSSAPTPAVAAATPGIMAGAALLPGSAFMPTVATRQEGVAQWGANLLNSLGERVNVQIGNGVEKAVIRLDPPMMGSLEISIRHEGGVLQVHLTATNEEVVRQLHAASEAMRQDLSQKQSEVTVFVRQGAVFANGEQQRGGQEQRDSGKQPGMALAEVAVPDEEWAFSLSDGVSG